jgi:hypothetical protein
MVSIHDECFGHGECSWWCFDIAVVRQNVYRAIIPPCSVAQTSFKGKLFLMMTGTKGDKY